jgi:sulfite exporter TauE/SafE
VDALILGFSSGATCLASCAPFIVPLLAVEGSSGRLRRLGFMGSFLAGRFLAYIAVGLLVGSLGAFASGFLSPDVDRILLRSGWAIGGLVLLGGGLAGFEGHALCSRLAAKERPGLSSLVLGLAAGLNACPPFIAAASRAAELGAFGGALYFALFFVGTSTWIVVLALAPPLRRKAVELKKVARITMVMLGFYFLFVLGVLGWS